MSYNNKADEANRRGKISLNIKQSRDNEKSRAALELEQKRSDLVYIGLTKEEFNAKLQYIISNTDLSNEKKEELRKIRAEILESCVVLEMLLKEQISSLEKVYGSSSIPLETPEELERERVRLIEEYQSLVALERETNPKKQPEKTSPFQFLIAKEKVGQNKKQKSAILPQGIQSLRMRLEQEFHFLISILNQNESICTKIRKEFNEVKDIKELQPHVFLRDEVCKVEDKDLHKIFDDYYKTKKDKRIASRIERATANILYLLSQIPNEIFSVNQRKQINMAIRRLRCLARDISQEHYLLSYTIDYDSKEKMVKYEKDKLKREEKNYSMATEDALWRCVSGYELEMC